MNTKTKTTKTKNKQAEPSEPSSARDRAHALSALITESFEARQLREAVFFAVYATDPAATPHGREVSRDKARSRAARRRAPWRPLAALGPRAIANIDRHILAECGKVAADAALPEWVRRRAGEFKGFETETPTRTRRNR